MRDNTTRRAVLKAAGSAGVASGMSISTAAVEDKSVETIEAGIEYEIPERLNYDSFHSDSRPSYTVDSSREKLILLKRMSKKHRSKIIDNPVLADEQPIGSNASVTVGPQDGKLNALPVRLSTRMRVTEQVSLVDPVQSPTVVIHTRGNSPAANVESQGKIELHPGDRKRIRLAPITATVRIKNVVETTSDEGRVRHEREFDTTEVQAVPVVNLLHRGELDLERQV